MEHSTELRTKASPIPPLDSQLRLFDGFSLRHSADVSQLNYSIRTLRTLINDIDFTGKVCKKDLYNISKDTVLSKVFFNSVSLNAISKFKSKTNAQRVKEIATSLLLHIHNDMRNNVEALVSTNSPWAGVHINAVLHDLKAKVEGVNHRRASLEGAISAAVAERPAIKMLFETSATAEYFKEMEIKIDENNFPWFFKAFLDLHDKDMAAIDMALDTVIGMPGLFDANSNKSIMSYLSENGFVERHQYYTVRNPISLFLFLGYGTERTRRFSVPDIEYCFHICDTKFVPVVHLMEERALQLFKEVVEKYFSANNLLNVNSSLNDTQPDWNKHPLIAKFVIAALFLFSFKKGMNVVREFVTKTDDKLTRLERRLIQVNRGNLTSGEMVASLLMSFGKKFTSGEYGLLNRMHTGNMEEILKQNPDFRIDYNCPGVDFVADKLKGVEIDGTGSDGI